MKYLFKTLLLFCILLHASIQGVSQNVTLVTGNLLFLKGQGNIRIAYDYSSMKVGNMTEEDYIKKKFNDYKDSPGRGEKWYTAWRSDRKQFFQPAFEENMNKHIAPLFITSFDTSTAYVLVVKTTYLEPGFRAYRYVKEAARINLTYTFINTRTREVVAVLSSYEVRCTYNSYDVASRVKSAYGNAGRILGKYIANIQKNDYVIQKY
jgi:hypothetical protein